LRVKGSEKLDWSAIGNLAVRESRQQQVLNLTIGAGLPAWRSSYFILHRMGAANA
jgi:hypothetical protein